MSPEPGRPVGIVFEVTRPDELERRPQERLDALGAAPRVELLHVLVLPEFDCADRMASSGATRRREGSASC